MQFTPVEAFFGGIALSFVIFWHTRLLPATADGFPSLRATLSAHPVSVAFTAGLISAGIMLSHLLPSAFHPLPLTNLPIIRLILAAALTSAGATLANACRISFVPPPPLTTTTISSILSTSSPSRSIPSPSPRRCPFRISLALFSASLTATLFASARFFTSHFQQNYLSPSSATHSELLSSVTEPSMLFIVHSPPRPYIALLALALLLAAGASPLLAQIRAPPPPPLLLETLAYVLGTTTGIAVVAADALHPGNALAALDVECDFWDPSFFITVAVMVAVLRCLPQADLKQLHKLQQLQSQLEFHSHLPFISLSSNDPNLPFFTTDKRCHHQRLQPCTLSPSIISTATLSVDSKDGVTEGECRHNDQLDERERMMEVMEDGNVGILHGNGEYLKLPDAAEILKPPCEGCGRSVAGAILFGAGCGLTGTAPHSALIYFGAFPTSLNSVAVIVTMFATTAVCSFAISVTEDRGTAQY